MPSTFQQLLDIPTTDPDDARRRKLLNVLLAGLAFLSLVGIVIIVALLAIRLFALADVEIALISCLAFLIGTIVIFTINRYWSGLVASTIFLFFLTLLLSFSDTPREVANGRTLFFFALPIIMASVLLRSYASFIFAGVCGVAIILVGFSIPADPNIIAIIGFFAIALISWLSSRGLEQALKDLRAINAELDQRVAERTRELSNALSRETIEAGRREAILNSIADGVVVFDRNGKAILANPSITNLINKPQEAIIGIGFNELLNTEELKPGDRGKVVALLEKSAQDLSNFRVDWGKKTLSVNAADVRDDKDRIIGTVAVMRDFTHEAELEKMKNTFMAIVSHELRTPLNAILGYAEMLKESIYGQLNEKQKNVSVRIMTNTQRLLNIVSDLLDQTQIESGKLKIQAAPCRPIELLDNLRGVMEKIASDKGITLVTELDSSMPSVIIGDPHRLQQIMVNLTNNAVKFTDEGSVHVKVFPGQDGKSWQIQTIDSGKGIPEDALEYIFESFRQVDGVSTRQQSGVGLGLSIVKQLVELMNGKIAVESEIEKGSTFTVTLPLIVGEVTKV